MQDEAPAPERLASCETAGVIGPVVGLAGAAAARALVRALDGERPPSWSALVQRHAGRMRRTRVTPAADSRKIPSET